MLKEMRECYATTPTKEMAELFSISIASVDSKAKEMGLRKDKEYRRRWCKYGGMITGLNTNNSGRFQKGHKINLGRKRKALPPNSKKIINTDTLEVYPSIMEASRVLGCTHGGLRTALKVGCRAKGYHWMYLTHWQYIKNQNENKPLWQR